MSTYMDYASVFSLHAPSRLALFNFLLIIAYYNRIIKYRLGFNAVVKSS